MKFCFLSLLACSLVSTASAQRLLTNDNKEVPYDEVTIQGNIIAWRNTDASGKERVLNIPIANIVRVDFPMPSDLQDAEAAINRGDGAAAAEKVESVLKQFTPFKTTAGSHWTTAALVKLAALGLQKKSDDYDKLHAEIKGINLSGPNQVRLGAVDASSDFVKGLLGPAKTSVVNLIPKTDDASVLAKLYNLLGDIHSKQGDYPSALESYLSVSVFYGSEADQLPLAELGAARSLKKMDRLEDSRDMFTGIKTRYPTSPQAQAATKELNDLLKVLGAAQAAHADEAEATQKAEMEKAAAAEKK